MLVLDEPTNDLDVDTLELLEELLAEYEGTLLLVSHDRTFLDNVVTSTLVFEGDGKVGEYTGGYEDWERYRLHVEAERDEVSRRPSGLAPVRPPVQERSNGKPRKLTYKEQRELEALPEKIESLEAEQSALHGLMGDADFYRQPSEKITATIDRLEAVKLELESRYARWQELELLAQAAKS